MAKATLHMKIEADLKDRLRQLAEQENRSLSNLVEKALKDYAIVHHVSTTRHPVGTPRR